MIAKKIRKEAKRNQLDVDDLANAVSSLQYSDQNRNIEARMYRDMIDDKNQTETLWLTASDIVDFIDA